MPAKLPTVVIVGRPNVGKSTLFNRVVRQRMAVVEDTPGITRDRLYSRANWNGREFQIVDTGGILFSDDDPFAEQIRVQADIALDEADVVLMVTDVGDGVSPDDQELADKFRGFKKPIIVVPNKADHPNHDLNANEFYGLGLGEIHPVSGLHGRNVADLLDTIMALLPEGEGPEVKEEIKIALVGRPNVGKSSLVNAFTGENRMIVSPIAGTTRDAIDTVLQYKDETFRLIDTAGIRRRGKIQGSVEYYMVDRAQKAIDRADCALCVIDGEEGLTDGDKRVMKLAHDAGKACVFAVNKWDLKEPPDGAPRQLTDIKKAFKKVISDEIPELGYAKVAFTSATEGAGLAPVLEEVLKAVEAYNFRVSTGTLNRLIQDAVFSRPYTSKGRPLKIYYATQVSSRPPTFVLFVNDPELLHFSYERYLLNKIREAFPLEGTPVRIRTKSSHSKPEDR